MNNHDKHYLTLGLQHGATQEEIHAAFQRMSVKYHPDNDSSLDAEMKFHEARQAYAALTKPAEPSFTPPKSPNATRSQTSEPPPNSRTREQASGFSNATSGARQQTTRGNNGSAGTSQNARGNNFTGAHAGARQQTTHNQNFTGSTNPTTGAKKGSSNIYGPDGSVIFDSVHGVVVGKFSDFPVHDYFHRLKVVLAVIGSIIMLFIAMRYITFFSFTHEASVRLFWHTTAFLIVSWLIFWYIRFSDPSRRLALLVIFSLGVVYACWMYFMTLPQEIAEYFGPRRFMRGQTTRFEIAVLFFVLFDLIFYFATHSLEREGLSGTFVVFKKKWIITNKIYREQEEERRRNRRW